MNPIGPKYRVLYAEDDPDDRFILQESFVRYAGEVDLLVFVDGSGVMDFLSSLPPAVELPRLLILDINMPRLGGKQVLATLRDTPHFRQLPVVLLTTSSWREDKDFAASANAYFHSKPNSVEKIHALVDSFMEIIRG
jgi:CheY-like chemotaxis protein